MNLIKFNEQLKQQCLEGWRIVAFGDIVTYSQYGLSVATSNNGNVPMLGMSCLKNGKVSYDNLAFVTLGNEEFQKFRLNAGDILINRTNSLELVGKTALVEQDQNVVFASYVVRFLVDPKQANPLYIVYYFNKKDSQTRLTALATQGVSQANINPEVLKKLFFLHLPSLDQQIAIANLLSTWDVAIEKIERLVTAQGKRLEWLLDLLMSPKDSKEKWRKVRLGNVVQIIKGRQLNVANMTDDGKYYALNGGISPSGYTNSWNTSENTITISEGGNSCGFVNFNTEKFWCGGHCYALKSLDNTVENLYLYYFLKLHEKSLMLLRVGSGLPNIQKKDLLNFSIQYPSFDQQKQIAALLNTAQQEINLLKKQEDALCNQKRGLMQQLLTGKNHMILKNNNH